MISDAVIVKSDDLLVKSHAICVLTVKSQFSLNFLNTFNFSMYSSFFMDFDR